MIALARVCVWPLQIATRARASGQSNARLSSGQLVVVLCDGLVCVCACGFTLTGVHVGSHRNWLACAPTTSDCVRASEFIDQRTRTPASAQVSRRAFSLCVAAARLTIIPIIIIIIIIVVARSGGPFMCVCVLAKGILHAYRSHKFDWRPSIAAAAAAARGRGRHHNQRGSVSGCSARYACTRTIAAAAVAYNIYLAAQ